MDPNSRSQYTPYGASDWNASTSTGLPGHSHSHHQHQQDEYKDDEERLTDLGVGGGGWDQQRESNFGASRGGVGGVDVMSKMDLVQAVDRSCSCCRIRKVRCDRSYPICMRCSKRKETCDYGDDFALVMRAARDVKKGLNKPGTLPLHISTSTANSSQPFPSGPFSAPPFMQTQSQLPPQTQIRRVSVSTGQTYTVGGPDDQSYQWKIFLEQADLGPTSSDWRIAQPIMASSLTRHLIDGMPRFLFSPLRRKGGLTNEWRVATASMHSCCFHLPAFHVFSDRVEFLKLHLDDGTLDVPSQAIVSVLASLGARASPHSALLGVAGPDVERGSASRELVLSAGQRRQKAWSAISNRAIELCSQLEVLQKPSRANAETLVAVAQMLLFADVRPVRARFFLRNALGLYEDVLSNPDLSTVEADEIKKAIGPTLFEADARAAAYTSMPFLISDRDFQKYFSGAVRLPDPSVENLSDELNAIFAAKEITRPHLDKALAVTSLFVCAVQRNYAQIAAPRKALDLLTGIPGLWASGDSCHTAAQQLHRRLASLDYIPAGVGDDHAYDILIGIRLDARIIDIFNLAHATMMRVRKTTDDLDQRFALDTLIGLSEKRVRKCLKLSAFYAKVFVDSFDKHLVYHLLIQLEVIPWVSIAVQRVGESTGPTSAEFEVSEVELDWFEKALELGCFYLPLAATRLQELREGRDERRFIPVPPQPPASSLPQVPTRTCIASLVLNTQMTYSTLSIIAEVLPSPAMQFPQLEPENVSSPTSTSSSSSSHSQPQEFPSHQHSHGHSHHHSHNHSHQHPHQHTLPPPHISAPPAYFPQLSPPSNSVAYLFDSYGTPSSQLLPPTSSGHQLPGQYQSTSPNFPNWNPNGYAFDNAVGSADFNLVDGGGGKSQNGGAGLGPDGQPVRAEEWSEQNWPSNPNFGQTPEGTGLGW